MQQQAADALDALVSDPLAVDLAVNEEGDQRETAARPRGAVKDTMTVSRVFGESYQVAGTTIVPVATVGTPPGGEGTRCETCRRRWRPIPNPSSTDSLTPSRRG
jgi:hypothetical protein